MRVGVLQSWLSERYLPFWEAYLQELEVEVVHPSPETVNLSMPAPIQRVMGEVFSLKNQSVDYLLLPNIQLGQESNRGNPSPWLVDLEATLRRLVPGLPPALVVPAELTPDAAGLAAEIGQSLTRNPMSTRRALERTKRRLQPEYKAPKQTGTALVGLVAQPVALETTTLDGLRSALEAKGLNLFLADKSPAELREEGQKLELPLELPTDLEAAGMHRYHARLGKVKALVYLHDEEFIPLPNPLRKLAKHNAKAWRLAGLNANWSQLVAELASELAV